MFQSRTETGTNSINSLPDRKAPSGLAARQQYCYAKEFRSELCAFSSPALRDSQGLGTNPNVPFQPPFPHETIVAGASALKTRALHFFAKRNSMASERQRVANRQRWTQHRSRQTTQPPEHLKHGLTSTTLVVLPEEHQHDPGPAGSRRVTRWKAILIAAPERPRIWHAQRRGLRWFAKTHVPIR